MPVVPAALRPLRCAAALRSRLARAAAPACRMASAAAPAGAEAAAAPPRGAFIVLEGTDRSGKSTQCARLVAALQAAGVDAAGWRFPDRTSGCGQMIDAYLRSQSELDDAAVHLLFSANRWEKRCGGGAARRSARSRRTPGFA
jgi:dTMP kinase